MLKKKYVSKLRKIIFLISVCCFSLMVNSNADNKTTLSGTVSDIKSGEALTGANVVILGTSKGTAADTKGHFAIEIEPGTYSVRISHIGYQIQTIEAPVTQGEPAVLDIKLAPTLIGVDEVVVIGTRRQDRTSLDTPVPVDILTASEIRQTGFTETNQVIQMLAPSFNFPRASLTDGTDHVRPSSLRGLGPDQVLVLINGKRRHTSALVNVNRSVGRSSSGVDLNAIPVNSIERIEILRDGAAAQYGSDAIAGVINIILKSDIGIQASVKAGQTTKEDGEVLQGNANYGFQLGKTGFCHLGVEYRDRGKTNRSGKPDYYWIGDPEVENISGFYNLEIPISVENQVYSFGGASYREGEAGGFYRGTNDSRNIRAIYPNGFLPIIHSKISDYSAGLGLKGSYKDWFWDVSNTIGYNKFNFNVKNSLNTSMGLATPTEFDCGALSFTQDVFSFEVSRLLDMGLAAPINFAMGTELRYERYQVIAGEEASYIHGGVSILDGPDSGGIAAAGAQVFPGYQPDDETDESRANFGVYFDLEGEVLPRLSLGTACRFEHYSDFGSNIDGKFSFRYELLKQFAFRGAVSTGFRAPSLSQEYYTSTSTNFINMNNTLQPFEVKTFRTTDAAAKALGAEELQPEKSKHLSLGIVAQPIENFSITADFYYIAIDDRIVLSGNFVEDTIQTILEANNIYGITGGRFFTNAINTETKGIDVIIRYGIDFGSAGVIRTTAGFNYTQNEVTHISDTPPQLAGMEATLFDRREEGLIEKGQPDMNANLSINHLIGILSSTIRVNRFGEIKSFSATPSRDQVYSCKILTDIDFSLRLFDLLTLNIGCNNLFDAYPDRIRPDNSYGGIFVYPSLSPFGMNGRFIYSKLSVDF